LTLPARTRRQRRIQHGRVALLLLASVSARVVLAAPPQLFAQPAHQGLATARPDELVLLAGSALARGDVVVYAALDDTTAPLVAPREIPRERTPLAGTLDVVTDATAPHALTVRIPVTMRQDRGYALWVRNSRGEWSNGLRVNDARPLWVSPSFVHASAPRVGLPRRLKVVGRNLTPAGMAATRLRLAGPERLELAAGAAAVASGPTMASPDFVAEFPLPPRLQPGDYAVAVSRDGRSWVPLGGQVFRVLPDPPVAAVLDIGDTRFGGCRADDGRDDTDCLLRALEAAPSAKQGAVLRFGGGLWELAATHAVRAGIDGIVLPPGVSIEGLGPRVTHLRVFRATDAGDLRHPVLTLEGRNTLAGLRFEDDRRLTPRASGAAVVRLGRLQQAADAPGAAVERVTITGNVFANVFRAIDDGGRPLRELVVTGNEFGAYQAALGLSGNRFATGTRFALEDAVIADNVFKPGGYLDVAAGTGSMATELGAGLRVDFSGNVADGTATDYLGDPPRESGWRAAFFWHLNGSQELVLVSRNSATCTGDLAGDGEAFAFDNNGNTFGLSQAASVRAATANTVTIAGTLKRRQFDRDVPLDRHYSGHWVYVADGTGLGQARRIVGQSVASSGDATTFVVDPPWDVVPATGSGRLTVSRGFRQLFVLDNVVDHRRPPCRKQNATARKGGGISLFAQAVDSVIAGNRQYDTDGIVLPVSYNVDAAECRDCASGTFFQYFVEVRENRVDGEYDWGSNCSRSGIALGLSAAPVARAPPPVAGYGISITRNVIRQADGMGSGAISVANGWYPGPPPHDWPLLRNLLVQHNRIDDVRGRGPSGRCDNLPEGRKGIVLAAASLVHDTVLYGNRCRAVDQPLSDRAVRTKVLCDGRLGDDCGCPAPR
jgi:hypothetical protein